MEDISTTMEDISTTIEDIPATIEARKSRGSHGLVAADCVLVVADAFISV